MEKKSQIDIYMLQIVLSIMIITGSCSRDDEGRLPIVTTSDVSTITDSTAISGGIVESDGGSEVTARGVIWNRAGDPIDSGFYTSDSYRSGSFISKLTNLEPETRYYVQAYATNSVGTAYGEIIPFITYHGCLFTFRGKTYKCPYADCGDDYLSSFHYLFIENEYFDVWQLTVVADREFECAQVRLYDPLISNDDIVSEKAQVAMFGDSFDFAGSGMHTSGGYKYFPQQLTGTCTCTERR
jgi:hypothetical protein